MGIFLGVLALIALDKRLHWSDAAREAASDAAESVGDKLRGVLFDRASRARRTTSGKRSSRRETGKRRAVPSSRRGRGKHVPVAVAEEEEESDEEMM